MGSIVSTLVFMFTESDEEWAKIPQNFAGFVIFCVLGTLVTAAVISLLIKSSVEKHGQVKLFDLYFIRYTSQLSSEDEAYTYTPLPSGPLKL